MIYIYLFGLAFCTIWGAPLTTPGFKGPRYQDRAAVLSTVLWPLALAGAAVVYGYHLWERQR